jgi:hypothetical protein
MIATEGKRLQMNFFNPTVVSVCHAKPSGIGSGTPSFFVTTFLRRLTGLACVAFCCFLFCALQTQAALAQAGGTQTKKQGTGAAQPANSPPGTAPANSNGGNPPPAKPAKTRSGTVAYVDLKSQKAALPYGQPFTITGDTKDVQLSGVALTELMKAQTVAGDYTTSDGNKGTITPSPITGTAWQVSIGKLTADTSVTINFQFIGTLLPGVQQTVIGKMMTDPAYAAATAQFITSAQGKDATAALGAMTLLSQGTVDVLTSVLNQNGLTPKTPADLKSSLGPVILTNIEPIFNLGQQLPELQNPAFRIADLVGMTSKDFSALSAQQLNDKLKGVSDYSKLPTSIQEVDKTAVQRFLQAYQNVLAALDTGMQSVLFLGSSSLAVGNDQQSDVVSDLKKYAGFDVGALYSYRLSELRSFAMVHIYLGPIQLKTDAPPLKPGAWESIRERVSLAFGMALKDLSGASNSKISSENAFVYGVGVRLNKYFRLSAGGMLYRTTLPAVNGVTSPANGTLRQEVFVGPSIDVTALSALKSIFAKSQSN